MIIMTVNKIVDECGFCVYNFADDANIIGCYCGDLLSRVMAAYPKNKAWITIMNNSNVIAVAKATGASCVVLTEGIKPNADMIIQAKKHGINVLGTDNDSYNVAVLISKII